MMFDILYINVGHAQETDKVACYDICQQSTVGIFPKHLSIDKKHPRILLLAKWQEPLERIALLLERISNILYSTPKKFMMESNPMTFDGSIAKSYDHYLVPFLFEPYAADLVNRVDMAPDSNLLELACGTGILTQLLVSHFSGSAEITATDINAEMLAFAQEKITAPNVGWDTVDMTAIPYEQELFDTVVCQFGLMFATDKARAVAEMHRVLKKGGKLLFNVWAAIADNPVWRIYTTLLSRFFPNNMPNPAFGPFSMADENYGLALLQQAGFTRYMVEPVSKTGICNTASNAAIGFILGTPLYNLIKNDPPLIQRFQDALEEAIALELGKAPIHSPLRSLVYSAEK
jgi:ubiquinone/menaquinone biosynthesis C-methylase UbiE